MFSTETTSTNMKKTLLIPKKNKKYTKSKSKKTLIIPQPQKIERQTAIFIDSF